MIIWVVIRRREEIFLHLDSDKINEVVVRDSKEQSEFERTPVTNGIDQLENYEVDLKD